LFLTGVHLHHPYREIALIREGNAAAAASLSGAILGFVLPLASAITHSVSLLDMAVWGLIALVVQLLVYGVAARFLLLPDLGRDIPAGQDRHRRISRRAIAGHRHPQRRLHELLSGARR
jgi:uncharacterized membrane protein YjfL (UPF0719 family)